MEAFGVETACRVFIPYALVQLTRTHDTKPVLATLEAIGQTLGGPLLLRHVVAPLAQQLTRVVDATDPSRVQRALTALTNAVKQLPLSV
jgi:hypothetical protein